MAKRLGPSKADKNEMLRYQAEDIVRQGLMDSPSYRKAVAEAMKELKKVKANAAHMVGK